jgi:hypothetical protein
MTKGTIFLVEIMLMPGASDMTVTFKWVINSLLYENGHELFIELFKYLVHPFTRQVGDADEVRESRYPATSYPENRRETIQVEQASAACGEEGTIPLLDYLTENAAIDAAKFEQLWANAGVVYVDPVIDLP